VARAGQGRPKKDEDTLLGVRRIQLRKCLIEIGKMATVLCRGGGLAGSVTARSIDRSERIRDAFSLTTGCQILYIAPPPPKRIAGRDLSSGDGKRAGTVNRTRILLLLESNLIYLPSTITS
jgi:hypothetical protein